MSGDLTSRGLALILLAFAVVLIGVLYSPVVARILGEQQILSQNLERLARFESMSGQDAELRRLVREAESSPAPVYVGPNLSAINAEFQIDVGRFAAATGASITSMRPAARQSAENENLQRSVLRIEMFCSTVSLARFLAQVRGHSRLIVVERGSVRAVGGGDGGDTNLAITLELVAFGEVVD